MRNYLLKLSATLFCVSLLVGLWGCSDLDETYERENFQTDESTQSYSLENVTYHGGTGSYMIPQNDPYTLMNFQNAYVKLANGNSDQVLTRSQMNYY